MPHALEDATASLPLIAIIQNQTGIWAKTVL